MKISIILAHPHPGSFNHAIAETVVKVLQDNGNKIYFHDLYKEGFDPLLPFEEIDTDTSLPIEIERHCRELVEVDGIVIVHPNWWGQPPAILKGWVDRIIRPGIAYEFLDGDDGEGIPKGLLKATTALVFNTSNTPSQREKDEFGDPLERLWNNCIFDLCGVANFYRRMFNIVIISTPRERKEWLQEVHQTVNRFFPKQG